MLRQTLLTASGLALLSLVSAHGGGMSYEINGVHHRGNFDKLKNPSSIQREWNWLSAEVTNDPYLACGPPGLVSAKSYHAPMKAGTVISINYTVPEELGPGYDNDLDVWQGLPVRRWTFGHDRGPMNAWMAPCPDEGCEKVNVNAPIWVKIWEAGLISGNWTDGYWAMRDVWFGANLDIPTPKSLKSGKYLLRHEMNNLINGGQWFPNCIQLDVTGDGQTSLPTERGVAVSFGGGDDRDAYAKDDGQDRGFCRRTKGCGGSSWFYGPAGAKTTYPMPGPPVWQG